MIVKGTRAYEILPGLLYMSANPAKWTNREAKLKFFKDRVKHVVILSNLDDPDLHGHDEFTVHHWPIVDGHVKLDSRLYDDITPKMVEWVHAGEPVLVACLVGRSRSGAAATLTVRGALGVDGSTALDLVRRERPNAVRRAGPEAELRSLSAP